MAQEPAARRNLSDPALRRLKEINMVEVADFIGISSTEAGLCDLIALLKMGELAPEMALVAKTVIVRRMRQLRKQDVFVKDAPPADTKKMRRGLSLRIQRGCRGAGVAINIAWRWTQRPEHPPQLGRRISPARRYFWAEVQTSAPPKIQHPTYQKIRDAACEKIREMHGETLTSLDIKDVAAISDANKGSLGRRRLGTPVVILKPKKRKAGNSNQRSSPRFVLFKGIASRLFTQWLVYFTRWGNPRPSVSDVEDSHRLTTNDTRRASFWKLRCRRLNSITISLAD